MYIHFTTQNFKHDTENYGYVGNPGLVNRDTGNNEISCGCYLDVDECYVTDGSTYADTYKPFSYHGFVPLHKDSENNDRLIGTIGETPSKLLTFEIAGFKDEDDNGNVLGAKIKAAIVETDK